MKKVEEIKTFDERKKELIEEGQKKGFITFEELAKSLQGLDMDADSLDQLYNSFIEAGISVITEEEATSEEGGAKKEEEVIVLDDEDLTKDVNINDPVRMYLKEIGRISLLTPEEEMDLSVRVANGDEEVKKILVERNLRLVAHVCKKYSNNNTDLDDLISIGTIGLIKGIDSFNYKKGVRLATYVSRCIDNAMIT